MCLITKVKLSRCITYCWNELLPKNFLRCKYLRLLIFIWSHTANLESLVTCGHHAVCDEWLLLHIVTGEVYASSTCHCCFISMLNSAYFPFFWYQQFAHYLNLVCRYNLNKLFYWFSQRVWCQSCQSGQFYWLVFPCPNTNVPDYSPKTLMDCIYSRSYFNLVEYFRASFSRNIFVTLSCLVL
jgi:hypothetical protein